jgi:D-serine deaminase-like pyridoxal phosphate-dependent protein
MHISDLDTPAVVIDLDIMDRNLARVGDYAREHNFRLRPHTKTHKIPALARKQLHLGAVGLTVAKVGEAEVMLDAEPDDLLIAFPVIGAAKLQRLMNVAEHTAVTVSLDSKEALAQLSSAAEQFGRSIGVLVEMDVGLGRVGVEPGPALLDLARAIDSAPGLRFIGLAFYPGHIKRMDESAHAALHTVSDVVTGAVQLLESNGFEVQVVSGGSTPTLFHSHEVARLNEIRPGTYIFNDRNTVELGGCAIDDCAATILATVVSTAVRDQIIIDGGSKTFSSDRPASTGEASFGVVLDAPEAHFTKMNEEHGFIDMRHAGRSFRIGDRIHILPNHICVAMNLHEQVYGVRGGRVEQVWRVEARGKLQ